MVLEEHKIGIWPCQEGCRKLLWRSGVWAEIWRMHRLWQGKGRWQNQIYVLKDYSGFTEEIGGERARMDPCRTVRRLQKSFSWGVMVAPTEGGPGGWEECLDLRATCEVHNGWSLVMDFCINRWVVEREYWKRNRLILFYFGFVCTCGRRKWEKRFWVLIFWFRDVTETCNMRYQVGHWL